MEGTKNNLIPEARAPTQKAQTEQSLLNLSPKCLVASAKLPVWQALQLGLKRIDMKLRTPIGLRGLIQLEFLFQGAALEYQ